MNHTNNEVKQLVARVCTHLARTLGADLAPEFLKAALPMLVNGTKEKNGYVKANSELSLVAVLRLRHGDTQMQVHTHQHINPSLRGFAGSVQS